MDSGLLLLGLPDISPMTFHFIRTSGTDKTIVRESWPICQQVHPRSANAETLAKMGDFGTFTGMLFNLTLDHTKCTWDSLNTLS
jgi:hypothetical protein